MDKLGPLTRENAINEKASKPSVPSPPREPLIRSAEVASRLGISQRSLHRLVASGGFPAPLRIGRSVRWQPSQVDAFIENAAQSARQTPRTGEL